jgi:NosR/NirI family transcriptional regulator, nitrous oxide reductase regulator
VSSLLERTARYGAVLRALLLCSLLIGLTTSAQPPAEEPAADEAAAQDAAGWSFDEEEEAAPTLLDNARDQALDIGLFLAFATLAMVSFLRKSVPLKYVTLVASVLYMGAYKSQLISVVNIFGAITANLPVFSYSMAWYAFAIFTVVTTLLWGRVYCGRICAFGALTQLIDAVVPKRYQFEVPAALEQRAGYIKYGILFAAVGYYLATSEIAFYRYIEPFWLFTFDATPVLWITVGVLLAASVFVRNLYCRFLCPLGAALGLVSSVTTVFKIKRWSECSQCALCEKTCEWGAIRKRQIIKSECVRCDDCEILYDDKRRCPHWLLELKRKARAAVAGTAA